MCLGLCPIRKQQQNNNSRINEYCSKLPILFFFFYLLFFLSLFQWRHRHRATSPISHLHRSARGHGSQKSQRARVKLQPLSRGGSGSVVRVEGWPRSGAPRPQRYDDARPLGLRAARALHVEKRKRAASRPGI